MFINQSMTKEIITITEDARIGEARDKMSKYKVRKLPVITEENRLVGIVTDHDIKTAMPSSCLEKHVRDKEMEKFLAITIKDIMTTDVITILPLYTIQDALVLFQKVKVSAMPVVDENGFLKGIISVRDMLRAFANVLGIEQPGTLICIIVEEKVGQLKKIVDAITEENISFGSVLVARYWEENKRAVFPYLLTNNVMRVKKKLSDLGFTLIDPMKWNLDQVCEKNK